MSYPPCYAPVFRALGQPLRAGSDGRSWYARCPVHDDRHPFLEQEPTA